MNPAVRLKQIALVLGDIIILYAALALTLVIRYQSLFSEDAIPKHLQPFSLLFVLWVLAFYINGLYEIQRMKNTAGFLRNLGAAITVNTLLSIIFFYFLTNYDIAPKTNLFIFLIIVFFFMYVWRGFYNNVIGRQMPMTKTAIIGRTPIAEEIGKTINDNPQLGYALTEDIDAAELIIVSAMNHDERTRNILYHYAIAGVEVVDTTTFYELIFEKVPIGELDETWFLRNLVGRHTIYDFIRLPVEIFFAAALGLITLPLTLLIALLIKLTSRGPVIYQQARVGEFGIPFTLYKFRSMVANAPDGSAEAESGPRKKSVNDPRMTPVGRFLVRTHLDELPQLINIIKGDASFVGPRPERPEVIPQFEGKIPYYELRHLVKPGITGWAQLHYGYGYGTSFAEDMQEKLQYDLYYLKHRSFPLDAVIILKTMKLFFTKPF